MSPAIHLIPLFIAVVAGFGLHRLNRSTHWFRVGELIFWDAIILVLVLLFWLKWF